MPVFHLRRAAGVVAAIEFDLTVLIGGCTVLFWAFQLGAGRGASQCRSFVVIYNGKCGFLAKSYSDLGDAASSSGAALLRRVLLGLPHHQVTGGDVLAVAHTGIDVGGDGVVLVLQRSACPKVTLEMPAFVVPS